MKKNVMRIGLFASALLFDVAVYAQSNISDGSTGIDSATNGLKTYYGPLVKLMYAIAALLGIIGGVKVYAKWNRGDNDTIKAATLWGGSLVFIVVVATVLSAFFNVSQ